MKILLTILFAATPVFCEPQAHGNILSAAQLEQAVLQEPGNASLYLQLGFAYSNLQKVDEAQAAFETVIRLDPSKDAAYFMLGLIYEKKGLKEKAIAAWKAYLELETVPHMREKALKHLHNLQN
ncbi:MAG TPA: hypothetical protein DCL44_12305 [Elusimicrobia bacterium]|nr:hypothetical protein [Elusimicrobiota bacterium]